MTLNDWYNNQDTIKKRIYYEIKLFLCDRIDGDSLKIKNLNKLKLKQKNNQSQDKY